MFLFDIFETLSVALGERKSNASVSQNAMDIQRSMIEVANETDAMICVFLEKLRARSQYELSQILLAEDH